MGKEQWQILFVLGAILLAGFFFQSDSEDVSGEAVRRSLPQAPIPQSPMPTAPICDYQPINQQFSQRLGSPVSLHIGQFVKIINNRYLAIIGYDNNVIPNVLGFYLYDIGIDGRFNTFDDGGFLVDSGAHIFYLDSITSNSVTTLYWYVLNSPTSAEIRQCTLTAQGCIPTTITTLPSSINVKGFVASASVNRLFFAQGGTPGAGAFILSCALQQGLPDSCTNGFNSFVSHQQVQLVPGSSTYTYRSISDLGFFISSNTWPISSNYIVTIQQPTTFISLQGSFNLNPTNHNPSTYPNIFIVQNTPSSSQLALVDSIAGTVTPIETLNPSSYTGPHTIQLFGSLFITLYQESPPSSTVVYLMGKRVGLPPVQIGSLTMNPYLLSAIILPDLTVLGILNTATNNLIQFACTP